MVAIKVHDSVRPNENYLGFSLSIQEAVADPAIGQWFDDRGYATRPTAQYTPTLSPDIIPTYGPHRFPVSHVIGSNVMYHLEVSPPIRPSDLQEFGELLKTLKSCDPGDDIGKLVDARQIESRPTVIATWDDGQAFPTANTTPVLFNMSGASSEMLTHIACIDDTSAADTIRTAITEYSASRTADPSLEAKFEASRQRLSSTMARRNFLSELMNDSAAE